MQVRNVTGVKQTDSLSGTVLAAKPLSEWVDVPYDVAMRLWRSRVVDINPSPGDVKDAWFKQSDGTHIFWASPFSLGDGYGTAASQLVLACVDAGLRMHIAWTWFHSLYGVDRRIRKMLEEPHPAAMKVGVCMATAGEFRKLPTPYKVGFTMYEADDPLRNLPEWRHDVTAIDLLLVPSEHSKAVFAQFTPCPIEVVPLIANPTYKVRQGERTRKPGQPFVFGMHGTLTERKSPLEVIDAFQRAFPTEQDVRLELKTRLGVLGAGQENLPALKDKRVRVHDENWLEPRMRHWLVNTVDCYIFASKGEGFALPPREAMLAGCYLAFSNHTGMTDMANPDVNTPLRWTEEQNSPLGGVWRVPDFEQLVETMRWAYENKSEAAARGLAGSEWYDRTHGPAAVAQRFISVIEAIDPGKPTRVPVQRVETIDKDLGDAHQSFYQALTAAIPKGATVVDLGVGGDGILYQWLTRNGYQALGVIESAREQQVREALQRHELPVNLVVLKNLADVHTLNQPLDAIVSMSVFQDYQQHEIELILRAAMIHGKPVFFSVPTVYYPEPFGPGARLRRRGHWEDMLCDFEYEFHYYGRGHRYLWARVIRLEQGLRATFEGMQRRQGNVVDGVWHPKPQPLDRGARGDQYVEAS